MPRRKTMFWLAIAAVIAVIGIRWGVAGARPPHTLGAPDGRLADCPNRPNCVSTQTHSPEHRVEPIRLANSSPEEALQRIEAVLRSMPRTQVVSSGDGYVHAEQRSWLLGFVDDVEFAIDDAAGLIHFRSSSRIGHSDLGVNRRRMEQIRSKLDAPD